jgi:hypothetical protein
MAAAEKRQAKEEKDKEEQTADLPTHQGPVTRSDAAHIELLTAMSGGREMLTFGGQIPLAEGVEVQRSRAVQGLPRLLDLMTTEGDEAVLDPTTDAVPSESVANLAEWHRTLNMTLGDLVEEQLPKKAKKEKEKEAASPEEMEKEEEQEKEQEESSSSGTEPKRRRTEAED